MLGDGVHFHFKDPHDAVMASLEIMDRVQLAGLPPAHVGVNAGPMIYDEGDYFGRTVNIAARIPVPSRAESGLRRGGRPASHHAERIPSRRLGAFELKGIAKPLTLYETIPDGDT
jgi:class 3 adenylate cyclase